MPLYWSYHSVPELAPLPKNQRKQIWRECRQTKSGVLWWWLVQISTCLIWLAAAIPLGRIVGRYPLRALLAEGALILASLAAADCILVAIYMREIRKRAGGH